MSLGGLPVEVLLAAARIRQRAGLGDEIPVVVFCVPTIPEGEEVAMANNIHVIRPDSLQSPARIPGAPGFCTIEAGARSNRAGVEPRP